MTVNANLEEFGGLQVTEWEADAPLADAERSAYRVRVGWDDEGSWVEKFNKLLDDPASRQLAGLVVGLWTPAMHEGNGWREVVDALVAAKDRLPNLRALFFGDISYEECEISWIEQGDISPLWDAYPHLERLGVRGTNNLSLDELRLPVLQTLAIESGGLAASIFHEILRAQLPALRHLEIWLGSENYGGTVRPEDLAPLLDGTLFPRLEYLGLRDSEFEDEIAAILAAAPVVDRLRVLDLSMGTLSDDGAAALLASPAVARLAKLDISHNYCSEAMVERLMGLGIEVDASDREDAELDDRFIAVSE